MKTRTEPANDVYRSRLRQWRGDRTQREAAVILGLSIWTYRNYEQGKRGLPLWLALQLERDHAILQELEVQQPAATGKPVLLRQMQG